MRERLFVRAMVHAVCEVHDWNFDRVRRELVPLMRARHGRGGVNVCVECIERIKRAADIARGRE